MTRHMVSHATRDTLIINLWPKMRQYVVQSRSETQAACKRRVLTYSVERSDETLKSSLTGECLA